MTVYHPNSGLPTTVMHQEQYVPCAELLGDDMGNVPTFPKPEDPLESDVARQVAPRTHPPQPLILDTPAQGTPKAMLSNAFNAELPEYKLQIRNALHYSSAAIPPSPVTGPRPPRRPAALPLTVTSSSCTTPRSSTRPIRSSIRVTASFKSPWLVTNPSTAPSNLESRCFTGTSGSSGSPAAASASIPQNDGTTYVHIRNCSGQLAQDP